MSCVCFSYFIKVKDTITVMGHTDHRHSEPRRSRSKSFVESIHLNLHSIEVYYKDGRTARLLKTAHDENYFNPEQWVYYQKKASTFLKEKVKLGEGKAFKTGKKNELGVHVVCRTNCLAAILITSRSQNIDVPFMEEWIVRMCLQAEGRLLARVLDNCVKKMPAELWAQEPRFFVDNGRMKYYEERLNELLRDEIDTFRGKKSRSPSESEPTRARTISQSYGRERALSQSSPEHEKPQTYLKERAMSLPQQVRQASPVPDKVDRTKNPLSAKMEKGLASTMEKAGLVQINIWKALGKGQSSQERSHSHPNLKMDKKLAAKMDEVDQWNKRSAHERSSSLSRLETKRNVELDSSGEGMRNEFSDKDRGLSPTTFGNVEDLSAELSETVPIQDQYQYQQFSSPDITDPNIQHEYQQQQQQGLDPTFQSSRQRYVSSGPEYAQPARQHRMRTVSSGSQRRDHADQVREILSNHERSMSPASFKIMDRTLSSDLDDIMVFDERSPSPGFTKDPRYSAGYEEKIIYQEQMMTSSPNESGNDKVYPAKIQHQPEQKQQIPMKLGKRLPHRMKERMIKRDETDQPAVQPEHQHHPHHHHPEHGHQRQHHKQVKLPKTPIQQRLIKWFEDRA